MAADCDGAIKSCAAIVSPNTKPYSPPNRFSQPIVEALKNED